LGHKRDIVRKKFNRWEGRMANDKQRNMPPPLKGLAAIEGDREGDDRARPGGTKKQLSSVSSLMRRQPGTKAEVAHEVYTRMMVPVRFLLTDLIARINVCKA
jgi:hypothetical protein